MASEAPIIEAAASYNSEWENIVSGTLSDFGGYTTLAVFSGIYMKALMNTMWPVNGDHSQVRQN